MAGLTPYAFFMFRVLLNSPFRTFGRMPGFIGLNSTKTSWPFIYYLTSKNSLRPL